MSWTVADVMTRDVVVVGIDEDFKSCVKLMNIHEVSALPVVDRDGRVLGVVSESDLLAKERERGAKKPLLGIRWDEEGNSAGRTAGDIMTSPAICITSSASVPEAARLMYREAVKRLPVIDENGKLIGVVSRADLLKTFTRSDMAIRRDIVDDVMTVLSIDLRNVRVEVTNGLVRLSGEVESRSLSNLLVKMTGRVEGTVGVDSTLKARLDDTNLHVEAQPQSLQLSASER